MAAEFTSTDDWKNRLKKSEENEKLIEEIVPGITEKIAQLKNSKNLLEVSKVIEKIFGLISWKEKDKDERTIFIQYIITCYVSMATDVKIFRIFVKIVNVLRKENGDLIQDELSTILWPLFKMAAQGENTNNIITVSNILDIDKNIREVIRLDVPQLLKTMSAILNQTYSNHDNQHIAIKLNLQAFQVTPEYGQYASSSLVLSTNNDSQSDLIKEILQALINVFFSKNKAIDMLLLAGTSFVMIVNGVRDCQQITTIYHDIFNSLHTEMEAKINIGTVEIMIPKTKKNTTVIKLVLFKSIVTCSRDDVLLHAVNKGDNSQVFFLHLFPMICELCDSNEDLYLSFQLFSLWFKQLVKLWPQISVNLKNRQDCDSIHGSDLNALETQIVEETIKYALINLECPVDDVPQFAIEILQSVLDVAWSSDRQTSIVGELMNSCLLTPWNIRSRYKPLQILIPYIQPLQLSALVSSIKEELLQCMSLNYLVPHASDVYKTFLQNILKRSLSEEERLEYWVEVWSDLLIKGVLSSDSLTCNKVNTYWVPITLKLLPSSGQYLQSYFTVKLDTAVCETGRQKLLYAWCVVVKNIRNSTGIDMENLSKDIMQAVLYSDDDNVRMEALGLICNSNKKAEPLSDTEMELLKEFLPLNLRVDSAPFRQLLGTNLQRLFLRIRDSCLSFIKKKASAQHLDRSIDFVDWLHKFFISNLVPGVSFQRRKVCLDNLSILYQVFLPTSSCTAKKKSQSTGSTELLVKYAQDKGLWKFFHHDNFVCLVHCLLDGADEIRELSYNLLHAWYNWSMKPNERLVEPDLQMLSCHLLVESLHLCNKPKASDSHSGALLCRLVFNKFSCIGLDFNIDKSSENKSPHITCGEGSPESSPVQFIMLLLQELEDSVKTAVDDPVHASQHQPIHGLVQAITFCMMDMMSHDDNTDQSLDDVVRQVVTSCIRIIDIMLLVMSGGKTAETCLSFAELGSAIETMVTDSQSDNTVLSPEFQCLLSWCWVNLKTCCTCLGEVLTTVLDSRSTNVELMANQIRDIYLKVLTNCRHRGAIEGCRNGLMKFCLTLMNSSQPELKNIPYSLLLKVFTSLESSDKMASITRRSAGLPIIVHVLMVAAKKYKQNVLIDDTLDKLYVLASEPIPSDWDQRQDLPAVHALNILKAVFSDSTLSSSLMPLYSKMIILVVESFESPSWAIRNASSQLFSTLILRMFGPKGSGSCLTVKELSAHYPDLPAFLLKQLDDCIVRLDDILHPTLYLVLTILSSLSPSPEDNSLQEEFRKRVSCLLSNPIYSLRELSALSMVALISIDKTDDWINELIERIPTSIEELSNHNQLHGHLILIEKLLRNRNFKKESSSQIIKKMLSRSWLMSSSVACRLLSLKFCHIVSHLVSMYPCDTTDKDILDGLIKTASVKQQPETLTIGKSLYESSVVDVGVALYRDDTNNLLSFYTHCLTTGSHDIRSSSLKQIQLDLTNDVELDWMAIETCLWKLLSKETNNLNVKMILILLCDIGLKNKSCFGIDVTVLRSLFNRDRSLLHHLLPVEGRLIYRLINASPETLNSKEICDWCRNVENSSNRDENEDIRLAATKCLLLAGDVILNMAAAKKDNSYDSCVLSLLEACLQLIDEEDVDIRKMAATFISQLCSQKTKGHHINSNYCIVLLLEYICDNFYWSEGVFRYLTEKLYQHGSLRKSLLSTQDQRNQVLFEHDEDSIFAERILRCLDYHKTLKRMGKRIYESEKMCVKFTLDDMNNINKELTENLPDLLNNIKDSCVISATSFTGVMLSLTGLVLLSDVIRQKMINFPTGTEETIKHLKYSVQSLFKSSHLHPWFIDIQDTVKDVIDS